MLAARGTVTNANAAGISPPLDDVDGTQPTLPGSEFQVALDKQLSSLRKIVESHHEKDIIKLRKENDEMRAALARLDSNQTNPHLDAQEAIVLISSEPEEGTVPKMPKQQSAEDARMSMSCKHLTRTGSHISIHEVFSEEVSKSRHNSAFHARTKADTSAFVMKDTNCLQCLVSHPFTGYRLFYDVMSMFVLTYDVITIPMEAASVLSITTWYERVGVVVTVFWTVDMFLSFFQGFNRKGVVELRPKETAWAYFRSWFLFDFTLVSMDYVTIFMESVSSAFGLARSTKTLRIGRIIRILRLSRMFRLPRAFKLFNGLASAIGNDLAESVARLCFWIIGLLFVNHFNACIWFFVGSNVSPGWVEFAKRAYKAKANKEASAGYLYTSSLHWSLTQFTPASMEVVPVNIYERIYTICTMFTALAFFSTFVSSITNEVASLRSKKRTQTANNQKLIQYLKENCVSLELGARIQDVALLQVANQTRITRVHESDVVLLKCLPVSLQEELHVEVYFHTIARNPFLRSLGEFGFQAITSLCHVAMRQRSLMAGQDVFTRGQDGTHVLFVIAGEVKYIHGVHSTLGMPATAETATIQPDEYLCEQVLFLNWKHQGLLNARTLCELVTLERAAFHQTLRRFPQTHAFCKRVASAYVDELMTNTKELTDLPLDIETMNEVLDRATVTDGSMLSEEHQRRQGLSILSQLSSGSRTQGTPK